MYFNKCIIENSDAYFHDGSVIDIQYKGTELLISMESAELSAEDFSEDIALSGRSTLKGILHLHGIKNIVVNEQPFNGTLMMQADSSRILDFQIKDNTVHFFLEWNNYPPSKKLKNDEYTDIVVEAESIFWENKPDLFDPFW